ncbi:MAG: hypothetical protein P4L46_22155 [Fimbriimonas sp.]|nr:hypothetical protein [Fimbriimonas sp.]
MYTRTDRDILRGLVEKVATAAADPVNEERARLWGKLNDLDSERPMVWITEIPWHEFAAEPELQIECTQPWARGREWQYRHMLYQWKHFPVDTITSPYLSCPISHRSTGYGLYQESDVVITDPTSDVVSREYHPQIVEPEDIEKIQMPRVTRDDEETDRNYRAMSDLFSDIMPIRLTGIKHIWYTPWDYLVTVWGVEQALMDLIVRPEMVHAAVDRVVKACMIELDQFVELGLLDNGNDNTRMGSGGYGYNSILPPADFNPKHVRTCDIWGCSNAQIFSAVSPEMLWEFAIEHDLPYLTRWGMNYYGCCEPLDQKIEVLRRIPNLRKISMSPFADMKRGSEQVGADYVLSHKPTPAQLAVDSWCLEEARAKLYEALDVSRGSHVEVILKDISTVRREPRRLWEWGEMAMEVVQEFAR